MLTNLDFSRSLAYMVRHVAGWMGDELMPGTDSTGVRWIDKPVSQDAVRRFAEDIIRRLLMLEQEAGLPRVPGIEDLMATARPLPSHSPVPLYTEGTVRQLVALAFAAGRQHSQ